MSPRSDRDAYVELLEEVGNSAVGLGLITFTVFPFALPLIALTAILLIPLVLGGLLVAVLAAPFVLAWRALRARRGRRDPATPHASARVPPERQPRLTRANPSADT